MKKWLWPVWGTIVVFLLWMAIAHADVPSRRVLAPMAVQLNCEQELSAIREGMFQSSMAESELAGALGDKEHRDWFYSRARYVRETGDLTPSPATCEIGNRKTLRIMEASWEYQYLIDMAKLERMTK